MMMGDTPATGGQPDGTALNSPFAPRDSPPLDHYNYLHFMSLFYLWGCGR